MIPFPRIGGEYWIVTDFYETFFAVPVKVIEKGGLFRYSNKTPELFRVRWQITEEYSEEYDASRRELYRSQRQAAAEAIKLNKEAGRE